MCHCPNSSPGQGVVLCVPLKNRWAQVQVWGHPGTGWASGASGPITPACRPHEGPPSICQTIGNGHYVMPRWKKDKMLGFTGSTDFGPLKIHFCLFSPTVLKTRAISQRSCANTSNALSQKPLCCIAFTKHVRGFEHAKHQSYMEEGCFAMRQYLFNKSLFSTDSRIHT